ncbi:MAG: UDP-N-acetylmuramoyl-L-alanyl-D-glutamate--2,6-diaminopimelate ligase [Candidatus Saccharimonadales bacterium]
MNVKTIVKKMLPSGLRYRVANFYHLLVAIVANIRYGFPARGAQVIMVTGTNGKTTTAALITRMLQHAGHKVGALTTAFYAFGDHLEPNTSNRTVDDIFRVQALLARMKKAGCEYLVIEVTSQALVQHRLWGVPVDVAVMTNLSQDHLDYHKTMDAYAAAKGKLFARRPRFTILNRDDTWFDYFAAFPVSNRMLSYGTSPEAECRIDDVHLHKNGSDVKLKVDDESDVEFTTKLPGKFNVYNAAAAIAVGYVLQLDLSLVAKGVEALEHVPGRLERVNAGQTFDVIVDYAHTPDALQNLLETLKHLTEDQLILVFGATGDRDKTKRPEMGEIAVKFADHIVLTDEEPYDEDPDAIRADIRKGIEKAGGADKTTEIADRREAVAKALKMARKGDTVAITGMGHEQFRVIKGERLPWNDTQVVQELLTNKRS